MHRNMPHFTMINLALFVLLAAAYASAFADNPKDAVAVVYDCDKRVCVDPLGYWVDGKLKPLIQSPCQTPPPSKAPFCSEYSWERNPAPLQHFLNVKQDYFLYVDGRRIGLAIPKGSGVRINDIDMRLDSGQKFDDFAIATHRPDSQTKGWIKIEVDDAYRKRLLRRVDQYIASTFGTKAFAGYTGRPRPVYEYYSVFQTGTRKIEFAAVRFVDDSGEGEGFTDYGISIGWGLTSDGRPIIFYPFQLIGEAVPNHLIGVLDIDHNGQHQLFFEWTDNQYGRYEIWQGNASGYRPIGEIRVWP